jgi:hypothetical protein
MKARKQTKADRDAAANFERLQAKWDKLYGPLTLKARRPAEFPTLTAPPGRETRVFPSRVTSGHSTTVKPSNQYSGSLIMGLGQLHKSNLVPVLRQEEAVDIAHMRR